MSGRAASGFGRVAKLCCSAVSPLETQHSSPLAGVVLVEFVLREGSGVLSLSRRLMLGRRGAFSYPRAVE